MGPVRGLKPFSKPGEYNGMQKIIFQKINFYGEIYGARISIVDGAQAEKIRNPLALGEVGG